MTPNLFPLLRHTAKTIYSSASLNLFGAIWQVLANRMQEAIVCYFWIKHLKMDVIHVHSPHLQLTGWCHGTLETIFWRRSGIPITFAEKPYNQALFEWKVNHYCFKNHLDLFVTKTNVNYPDCATTDIMLCPLDIKCSSLTGSLSLQMKFEGFFGHSSRAHSYSHTLDQK